MRTKMLTVAFLFAFIVTGGFFSISHAQLAAVGPVNGGTGFPDWFQDTVAGTRLAPCDVVDEDPNNQGLNLPPCSDLILLNFGLGFTLDNIQDVIYYRAQADILPPSPIAGSRVRLDVRGEGPNETVFNEIEVRLRNLPQEGNYTVVTPFGTFIVPVVNLGETIVVIPGSAIGLLPDFAGALTGNVDFFLPNTTGFTSLAGTFLGDGVTPAPLIPGTFVLPPDGALHFRVIGPAGSGVDETQPNFTVEAKVDSFILTVTKAGPGTGTVTSAPAGINCGLDCQAPFLPNAVVTLTGAPDAGFALVWTGCDSINPSNQCVVTMNGPKTVAASFNNAPAISVSPPSRIFGVINVGSVGVQTFTVTNTGAGGLIIGSITVTGTAGLAKGFDNCSGQTLPQGGSCTVQARYLPLSVANDTGTMSIPSNDPITPVVNVSLEGSSTAFQFFTDVLDTSPFENHINSLRNNGITTGCSLPLQFCPGFLVTRGEMSAFIIRALEGEPQTGPPTPTFTDVPLTHVFFRHVERMAARGITLGIGGGLYGPDLFVTRAEMASFLVRAVDGVNATVCTGVPFTDVPVGAPHCANIERLRNFAPPVTLGCGTNLYCPNDGVPREQMAAFIARAFLGLP